MFLPYNVDVPLERLPIANWVLIALTVATSLLSSAGWWQEWFFLVNQPPEQVTRAQVQALKEPPAGALRPDRFAFSQLVTHLFVHADFIHLLLNVVFLFCFGNAVNAKLGQVSFLLLYFLFGAVAGLGWLLLGPNTPAVGASAAINGIVGVFVVLFPRNHVRMMYSWRLRGAGSFELPALVVVLLFLGFDVLGVLLDSDSNVGYVAHVIGLAAGVLTGLALVALGLAPPTRYEENLLQVLGVQEKTG
jgi:membrane associated rhomboid family serine protease